MLKVMARTYVTTLVRGETCNITMKDIVDDVPWIKGVSVIGPDGRIKCATLPTAVGLDVSDRPYYHEAVRTRDFVVSDYVIGRASRTPVPCRNEPSGPPVPAAARPCRDAAGRSRLPMRQVRGGPAARRPAMALRAAREPPASGAP